MPDQTATHGMSPLKILVVASSGLLTLVGIFDALTNLPVVSGCAFYGECHRESFRDPPGEMGKDVP
ncbi:hypothetical protein [Novosphingobium sp. AP12]|uniref:hypothetical protein n=1 Tax=Novosphingobium sp. AP12 TaxID=1144305 RepID=UPI0012F9A73F|nr:hypothetical protein [Novosphingobium sp. AP12]